MSENKKAKSEEKSIEERVMALEKIATDFAAWRRRVSANWKNFYSKFVDSSAHDGKLPDTKEGSVRIIGLIMLAGLVLLVGLAVSFGSSPDLGQAGTDLRNDGKFRIDANGSTSMSSNLTVWGNAYLYGITTISNLAADMVNSNNLVAGDYGDVSVGAVGTVTIDSGTVSSNDLVASNMGNISVSANGTVTINSGTVSSNDLVASDMGVITVGSAGTITLDDDTVTSNNLVAADLGAISVAANGTVSLDDDTVTKGKLNAEDFGDFTAGADGTCTIDAGAVSSNKLTAGNYGSITVGAAGTVSFNAGTVNSNNLTAGDYGEVTVAANGTIAVDGVSSANDIILTNLAAKATNIFADITVVATTVSTTQATVVVTCKNVFGDNMGRASYFWAFFAETAASKVPSTNNINSWSFVTHGNNVVTINATGERQDLIETHTDGTADYLITSSAASTTNNIVVVAPNGRYVSTAVRFQAP